jgi:hypothetical protein
MPNVHIGFTRKRQLKVLMTEEVDEGLVVPVVKH